MEIIQGTIIYKKSRGSGFLQTILSEGKTLCFFSKEDALSVFENCEVALTRKNNSYFLSDFTPLEDPAPLIKYPENIIAASWLAELARSFVMPGKAEMAFVDRCRAALLSNFNFETLDLIERDYCKISGFPDDENREDILKDYFPYSINIRKSLIKQLNFRGKNGCSSKNQL